MYEAYKKQTDALIKSLMKQSFAITTVVLMIFIVTIRAGSFDWRTSFLFALPLWNWLYSLIVFTQRNKLLCELKENNVETKTITVKKMARNDHITYVSVGLSRGFSYGVLRYKIKDSENRVYYFEDIFGGNQILPKVKSCKVFTGKEMEITCTKGTHYIVGVSFSADKDTNFFKQEMNEYFR